MQCTQQLTINSSDASVIAIKSAVRFLRGSCHRTKDGEERGWEGEAEVIGIHGFRGGLLTDSIKLGLRYIRDRIVIIIIKVRIEIRRDQVWCRY